MNGLVQKFAGVSSNGRNGICDDLIMNYEQ